MQKKIRTLHTKLFTVTHFCNVFGFYNELENYFCNLKKGNKEYLQILSNQVVRISTGSFPPTQKRTVIRVPLQVTGSLHANTSEQWFQVYGPPMLGGSWQLTAMGYQIYLPTEHYMWTERVSHLHTDAPLFSSKLQMQLCWIKYKLTLK